MMVSLFDYFGKAAGMDLGGQVYNLAVKRREEMHERKINTKKYKGTVRVYREEFLDSIFNNENRICQQR